MTPEQAFGSVLRELRREQNLTQERLAEATRCTRPYISYMESGRYSPTLSMLFSLANALHTTPADLLQRTQVRLQTAP